ncbi:N-6 DNA methylase [Sulfurimonas sp. HSL1-6]|uniref:class I SAM-dependent DNA methyltransferase n=1 Tax=Thiomicrolovo immobilis TaxID=3131935 RepID=UPI0031F8091B
MNTNDIVSKLWNLCNILKDDGITYHQYVTELTLLLFLKMAKETGVDKRLPEGYRWDNLTDKDGVEQYHFYRELLVALETAADSLVASIYQGANTSIREPKHLTQLIDDINNLDWYGASREDLGDMYEGLLEKNASETKSGAGQYFTPRVLIDCMVEIMDPKAGEVIQDPAAGTGGFLLAADRYIRVATDDYFDLNEEQIKFQKNNAYVGMELVPDTHRLALMNTMLHDLEGGKDGVIRLGNTLSAEGQSLPKANVILSNPPFGTKKGGGLPTRDDFTYPTSNKQLAFLQHIYRGLKEGGRAAVVLPDNVLFEGSTGKQIRQDLMNKCNLHTILRLPTGIFYAQGVKTNVLFFERGKTDIDNTKEIWVYDMRANMPKFGKRTPLTRKHFDTFVEAYQATPRVDEGEEGRFRCFSRGDIAKRDDSLDISWLKDESLEDSTTLSEPDVLAIEARDELFAVINDLEELLAQLGVEVEG